jgi:hypothetical protein
MLRMRECWVVAKRQTPPPSLSVRRKKEEPHREPQAVSGGTVAPMSPAWLRLVLQLAYSQRLGRRETSLLF